MIESGQSFEKIVQMGWYLDTCLFKDFIERNVRKAFDKSEEFDGKTYLKVEGLSGGRNYFFVPALYKNRRYAFELTETLCLLQAINISNGTKFYFSELTKAEVFRALRKAHPKREKREILDWWDALSFVLGSYSKVDINFSIAEELSNLALDFPIRKNVQDYIHLIIAKKKDLAFLTSDKLDDQINDLKANFYSHIYFWPEIKYNLPVDEPFKEISSRLFKRATDC